MTPRAATYTRVSTEEQLANHSLETQASKLAAFAENVQTPVRERGNVMTTLRQRQCWVNAADSAPETQRPSLRAGQLPMPVKW